MNKEQILLYFENKMQIEPIVCRELPASGSARKNFVIETKDNNYIVTYNDNIRENESFFYLTEIFEKQHLNTPHIFDISEDKTIYIQSFLGQETLSEIIANEGLSKRVENLVQQSLDCLFVVQQRTINQIDYSQSFEYQAYNHYPILHDLYYFKFMFVDVLGLVYHKESLLIEFQNLTEKIEALQPKGIMIRDFQSRNILVNDDKVYFIDYQSAMQGPLMYDVISFLFQAKANFTSTFQQESLQYYWQKFPDEEQIQLKESTPYLQLIRFLQVLGAYGFRGLVQKKAHFLESIPQGITNLTSFINSWNEIVNFPELEKIIKQLEIKKNSITKI
ncbi:MAG: phosphotransferase [Bacteroidetes bacterium]|nr:phosphotransferase [Bacteroidota bacterium]